MPMVTEEEEEEDKREKRSRGGKEGGERRFVSGSGYQGDSWGVG